MTPRSTAKAFPDNIEHLVLDRDGVLNREPESGWITDPEAWVWEEGSLEALSILTAAGIRLSVVTNQSCVGRGLVPEAAVLELHRWVLKETKAAGAAIAEILVCPHAPDDGCQCRKPRPGLVLEAIRRSDVPPGNTALLGDADRDLEAGIAAGLDVMLVLTGKGESTRSTLSREVPTFQNLLEAAREMTSG